MMRGRRRDRDQSPLRGMKGHSLLSGETDQQKALPEDVLLSGEALPEEVETRTEVAPQAAPTPVAEPGGVPAGPSGEGESEPEPATEIAPPATEQLAAKAEPALVEASRTVGSEQNADAEPVEVPNGRMVQAASGNT